MVPLVRTSRTPLVDRQRCVDLAVRQHRKAVAVAEVVELALNATRHRATLVPNHISFATTNPRLLQTPISCM